MTTGQVLEKMGLSVNQTESRHGNNKSVVYDEIKSKDRIRFGVKYPGQVLTGYKAVVMPGKSIRLHGSESNLVNGPVTFDITFKIGDYAEYDSYNLKYTGKITAIGPKTVTVQERPGTCNAKNHKLSIYTFSWRNFNYDGKKIAAHNAEERYYI